MTRHDEPTGDHSPRPAAAGRAPFPAAARLAGIALLPLLAACGGDPPAAGRWQLAARLSVPPDARVFSLADVGRETVTSSWLMSEPAQAAAWEVEPAAARGTAGRHGLELRVGGGDAFQPRLRAAVEIDARQVSIIELQLRNPGRASSRLLWAGTGQELDDERSIDLAESEPSRDLGPIRVLRFRVGEHPEWRGTIRRLEIRPAIGSQRDFNVTSVRALQQQPSADLLAAAGSRAWTVGFGETLREARLAFPGRPWEAALELPEGPAELRFVPGLSAETGGEIELSIQATDGSGRRRRIFSKTYSRRNGDGGSWEEPVRLPLDGPAHQKLDLVFAMSPTGSEPRTDGFAAWGGVQLLAAGHEPAPPNVVLICIDTLRADRLSAYGHDRQTSPNIDRWAAQRAVLFEQTVAPAPWTLPSLISIFTGLDAVRHGGNYHLPAPPGLEMLAETLARRGYETAAWTGGGYLGPAHGLHQGFESFTYHLGAKERELADNVERAIGWLGSRRDRPFFLLFHTYEVHSPYFERQPFYDQFAEASGLPPIPSDWVSPRRRPRRPGDGFMVSSELMMSPDHGETWQEVPAELSAGNADRYDSGVAYADRQIGRLLDALDEGEHSSRSVVILTSDHGEALGERGLSGHSYLYDFNLLVPLLVAAPSAGWPGGKRVRQQVRSIDIVPTVRDLLGIEADAALDGETLAPLVSDRPAADRLAWSYAAIANRGVALRLPKLKYIFNNAAPRPIFARQELFDLDRDPAELSDLAEQRLDEAARLGRLVRGRLTDQVAAVWFHLQSGQSHPLRVELTGPDLVGPSRLKALELPGAGIRYGPAPALPAIVELPAATEALLYSEIDLGGAVQLRVSSDAAGAEPRLWRLRVSELAGQTWSASVSRGAWTERPTAAGDAGPRLSIFSTRQLATGSGPARPDRKVEEQLRALGYLQ